MGRYYPTTLALPLIGSKNASTKALTGVTLESTYQAEAVTKATKTFEVAGYPKLNLDFAYTMGASETANTVEIKLEASPDGVNFYQLGNTDSTAGASTIYNREFTFTGTNGALAKFQIFLDIGYKFLRVSVKESGVAANKGTLYVEATLSGR